jgi:ABC-type sugar transport system permease subunit
MSTTRTSKRKRPRSQYGSGLAIASFLFPAIALYSVLTLYPAVISLYYSLLNWNGGPLSRAKFIGLGNFRALLHDPYLPGALENNLRVVALSWLIQVPLALVLAFVVIRIKHGASVYRFLFIIPYIVPMATLALVWGFFFSGNSYGQLNAFLEKIGLGGWVQQWLSADGVVQWVTSAPQAMVYVGFFMVIFIAALVGIPDEYYEAAAIDGAGALRQLIHVALPGVRGIYISSMIVSLQLALAAFVFPYLMTEGGPIHISDTTVSYSLYLLYSQQEWGYASAVNVLIFVFGALTVALVWRLGNGRRRAA